QRPPRVSLSVSRNEASWVHCFYTSPTTLSPEPKVASVLAANAMFLCFRLRRRLMTTSGAACPEEICSDCIRRLPLRKFSPRDRREGRTGANQRLLRQGNT